jgi:hypothetical protein
VDPVGCSEIPAMRHCWRVFSLTKLSESIFEMRKDGKSDPDLGLLLEPQPQDNPIAER